MTKMLEPIIAEMQQEAATTRRLLERVPDAKLTFKPHHTCMTMGQLAIHTATIPGVLTGLAQLEEFDAVNAKFDPPQPASTAEILKAFDESIATAEKNLSGMTDSSATGNFRMLAKGREVFVIPRMGMLRAIVLNHWYHHRGQLSVYLRMLEVPIPVIYGRSADENPFA
jgi:uncharacterized damage-inducible protein DinB